MSPWVEKPKSCEHPGRPEPQWSDDGRVWECDACGLAWRAVRVDYGHDVMPGERPVGARWEPSL